MEASSTLPENRSQAATKTSRKLVQLVLAELKQCSITRNLQRGKQAHARATHNGSDSSVYVATALIKMYARCGSMVDARQVFDGISQPDVVAWTALIFGYAEKGESLTALELLAKMKSQGCAPDYYTFVAALKACSALAAEKDGREECLKRGKLIHSEIGCHSDIHLQSTLIDMYIKCGSLTDARQVFNGLKHPDMVSWNTLILGYAENGEGHAALDLFASMKSRGCAPDSFTLVAALKACSSLALELGESGRARSLERGKQIHSAISEHCNIYVQTALIDMYAKCGSIDDARQVFDGIEQPDAVSWTSLILGYAEAGKGRIALDLFTRMRIRGCTPDSLTFVAALKACISITQDPVGNGRAEGLKRGKRIHSEIGYHSDICVQSALIDVYARCGRMVEARRVFDSIEHPNVVAWTALISGYADNGKGAIALNLFADMKSRGCAPESPTFVAALKACALLGALECGRRVHSEIGMKADGNAILVTCLVDFYAKCGALVEAHRVFDLHPRERDLRTWTALLAGYSRLGDDEAVFELFGRMQDAGIQPNVVTFLCVLSCCSHAGLVEKANEVFESMSSVHGLVPAAEHYNCMLDILGRSNKLDRAMTLLRSMPCRPNAVTWLTVLGACRKWKSVGVGRLAFEHLVGSGNTNGAAFMLMAQIYESRGMWIEQKMVLEMKQQAPREAESCWANEFGTVHSFLVGEDETQLYKAR